MTAIREDNPSGAASPPQNQPAYPQALLDSFDALTSGKGLWDMLQEIAQLLVPQAAATGSALMQWVPETEILRVRSQFPVNPAFPVGPIEKSPVVESSPIIQSVIATEAAWQGDFSELAGLGLEEALGLPKLSGHALLKTLIYRHEVRGLSLIWDEDPQRVFSQDEIVALRVFLRHAAIAFENQVLLHEAKQINAELEALRQATLNLTSSLELDEVLHAILESALRLLKNVLDAHIFLYDGKTLSFGAAMWADGRKGHVWSEPRRGGLTYSVAESGDLVVVPDMSLHPIYEGAPAEWSGAIIGAPLRIANRVVGVMNVAYDQPREFSERELRQVTLLADQAAIAVHNASLHSLSREEALTDPLTELPNRRAFDRRIEEEIRRSARYGHQFSLVMMDLDGFKRVNDINGHQMGDIALREIARCLRHRVRDTDFLARYGGDEFILILPETKSSDAGLISQKLRTVVSECEIPWGEATPTALSLSVGVAGYPGDGSRADQLVRVADKYLYRSKGD